MKRICKFITIPIGFAETSDLSLPAKWVAVTIDSYTDNPAGVAMGVRAIQTATNLSAKEVKQALTELSDKGCLQVSLDQDGQKLLKALLYKDRYVSSGERVAFGDKPSDAEPIDYQAIIDAWNEHCERLPKVERLTPKRKLKTRTTLKGAGCTESDLIKAIRLVSASAFLNGSKTEWSATYDWLVKNPENLTKVLEGNYHKDYSERRMYEAIMHGGEVNQQSQTEDYYR